MGAQDIGIIVADIDLEFLQQVQSMAHNAELFEFFRAAVQACA